jgi:hypothetical protein
MNTKLPSKIKIRLQKRDVQGATGGHHDCPIARAINRTLGIPQNYARNTGAAVSYSRISVVAESEDEISIGEYRQTQRAKDFMSKFDCAGLRERAKLPYDLKFTFIAQ